LEISHLEFSSVAKRKQCCVQFDRILVKDKINISQNIIQTEPDEKHSGCIVNAQNLITLKLA